MTTANDPIPITAKQAWVIRRKWDASEVRYQQIMERAAAAERLRPEVACATVDQSDDRRKWYG